ncbi:hypothetical protein EB796_000381 [Bugula neritina]|uniref:Ctf8 n=1 Tax=Bugula neritina TaxID=10212 RepID=A0A7J7KT70_BUGNE|nr:hypothetical protein EB796_000381 [Bugula neritina]
MFLTIGKTTDTDQQETVIIELQGELQSRVEGGLDGKFIGNLVFTNENKPIMIIGHHILHGKIANLEKPLAVIRKSKQAVMDSESCKDNMLQNYYDVTSIIKRKIIFSDLPKPIIASVPKTL